MTTRPGAAALQYLAGTTGKRLCYLLTIQTLYGDVLRFTTHDRAITGLDGEVYEAAAVGQLEDSYTEAAFRGSTATGVGLIDGTNVVINDIAGGRYRGAKVIEQLVDWRNPNVIISTQVRTITQIRYTAKSWTATMESLTARLRKPQAGRFNGIHTARCPYRLGDARTCKKDISTLNFAGAEVDTVINPRSTFTTNPWPYTPSGSNWWREGEFEFLWDPATHVGTVTSGILAGGTVVTDSTKSWAVDELVGEYVRVKYAANPERVSEYFKIKSNTATTITVQGVFLLAHSSGVVYDVCPSSDKHGLVAPVGRSENSSREIELFFPTPLPIIVGESGVLRVGCDGLFGTCQDKFANQLNFGGLDVNAPDATDITSTPEDAQ